MTMAIISVGSNQSDPQQQNHTAFKALDDIFKNVRMSQLFLTEPVGPVPQNVFTNAGISMETSLAPEDLLKHL
jgi:2-amino-4-hydroxy-6-hydroxymethyldihydropteridine diphosphokinase